MPKKLKKTKIKFKRNPALKIKAKNIVPKEIGGASGPEPTRYGDWQFKGRVSDF